MTREEAPPQRALITPSLDHGQHLSSYDRNPSTSSIRIDRGGLDSPETVQTEKKYSIKGHNHNQISNDLEFSDHDEINSQRVNPVYAINASRRSRESSIRRRLHDPHLSDDRFYESGGFFEGSDPSLSRIRSHRFAHTIRSGSKTSENRESSREALRRFAGSEMSSKGLLGRRSSRSNSIRYPRTAHQSVTDRGMAALNRRRFGNRGAPGYGAGALERRDYRQNPQEYYYEHFGDLGRAVMSEAGLAGYYTRGYPSERYRRGLERGQGYPGQMDVASLRSFYKDAEDPEAGYFHLEINRDTPEGEIYPPGPENEGVVRQTKKKGKGKKKAAEKGKSKSKRRKGKKNTGTSVKKTKKGKRSKSKVPKKKKGRKKTPVRLKKQRGKSKGNLKSKNKKKKGLKQKKKQPKAVVEDQLDRKEISDPPTPQRLKVNNLETDTKGSSQTENLINQIKPTRVQTEPNQPNLTTEIQQYSSNCSKSVKNFNSNNNQSHQEVKSLDSSQIFYNPADGKYYVIAPPSEKYRSQKSYQETEQGLENGLVHVGAPLQMVSPLEMVNPVEIIKSPKTPENIATQIKQVLEGQGQQAQPIQPPVISLQGPPIETSSEKKKGEYSSSEKAAEAKQGIVPVQLKIASDFAENYFGSMVVDDKRAMELSRSAYNTLENDDDKEDPGTQTEIQIDFSQSNNPAKKLFDQIKPAQVESVTFEPSQVTESSVIGFYNPSENISPTKKSANNLFKQVAIDLDQKSSGLSDRSKKKKKSKKNIFDSVDHPSNVPKDRDYTENFSYYQKKQQIPALMFSFAGQKKMSSIYDANKLSDISYEPNNPLLESDIEPIIIDMNPHNVYEDIMKLKERKGSKDKQLTISEIFSQQFKGILKGGSRRKKPLEDSAGFNQKLVKSKNSNIFESLLLNMSGSPKDAPQTNLEKKDKKGGAGEVVIQEESEDRSSEDGNQIIENQVYRKDSFSEDMERNQLQPAKELRRKSVSQRNIGEKDPAAKKEQSEKRLSRQKTLKQQKQTPQKELQNQVVESKNSKKKTQPSSLRKSKATVKLFDISKEEQKELESQIYSIINKNEKKGNDQSIPSFANTSNSKKDLESQGVAISVGNSSSVLKSSGLDPAGKDSVQKHTPVKRNKTVDLEVYEFKYSSGDSGSTSSLAISVSKLSKEVGDLLEYSKKKRLERERQNQEKEEILEKIQESSKEFNSRSDRPDDDSKSNSTQYSEEEDEVAPMIDFLEIGDSKQGAGIMSRRTSTLLPNPDALKKRLSVKSYRKALTSDYVPHRKSLRKESEDRSESIHLGVDEGEGITTRKTSKIVKDPNEAQTIKRLEAVLDLREREARGTLTIPDESVEGENNSNNQLPDVQKGELGIEGIEEKEEPVSEKPSSEEPQQQPEICEEKLKGEEDDAKVEKLEEEHQVGGEDEGDNEELEASQREHLGDELQTGNHNEALESTPITSKVLKNSYGTIEEEQKESEGKSEGLSTNALKLTPGYDEDEEEEEVRSFVDLNSDTQDQDYDSAGNLYHSLEIKPNSEGHQFSPSTRPQEDLQRDEKNETSTPNTALIQPSFKEDEQERGYKDHRPETIDTGLNKIQEVEEEEEEVHYAGSLVSPGKEFVDPFKDQDESKDSENDLSLSRRSGECRGSEENSSKSNSTSGSSKSKSKKKKKRKSKQRSSKSKPRKSIGLQKMKTIKEASREMTDSEKKLPDVIPEVVEDQEKAEGEQEKELMNVMRSCENLEKSPLVKKDSHQEVHSERSASFHVTGVIVEDDNENTAEPEESKEVVVEGGDGDGKGKENQGEIQEDQAGEEQPEEEILLDLEGDSDERVPVELIRCDLDEINLSDLKNLKGEEVVGGFKDVKNAVTGIGGFEAVGAVECDFGVDEDPVEKFEEWGKISKWVESERERVRKEEEEKERLRKEEEERIRKEEEERLKKEEEERLKKEEEERLKKEEEERLRKEEEERIRKEEEERLKKEEEERLRKAEEERLKKEEEERLKNEEEERLRKEEEERLRKEEEERLRKEEEERLRKEEQERLRKEEEEERLKKQAEEEERLRKEEQERLRKEEEERLQKEKEEEERLKQQQKEEEEERLRKEKELQDQEEEKLNHKLRSPSPKKPKNDTPMPSAQKPESLTDPLLQMNPVDQELENIAEDSDKDSNDGDLSDDVDLSSVNIDSESPIESEEEDNEKEPETGEADADAEKPNKKLERQLTKKSEVKVERIEKDDVESNSTQKGEDQESKKEAENEEEEQPEEPIVAAKDDQEEDPTTKLAEEPKPEAEDQNDEEDAAENDDDEDDEDKSEDTSIQISSSSDLMASDDEEEKRSNEGLLNEPLVEHDSEMRFGSIKRSDSERMEQFLEKMNSGSNSGSDVDADSKEALRGDIKSQQPKRDNASNASISYAGGARKMSIKLENQSNTFSDMQREAKTKRLSIREKPAPVDPENYYSGTPDPARNPDKVIMSPAKSEKARSDIIEIESKGLSSIKPPPAEVEDSDEVTESEEEAESEQINLDSSEIVFSESEKSQSDAVKTVKIEESEIFEVAKNDLSLMDSKIPKKPDNESKVDQVKPEEPKEVKKDDSGSDMQEEKEDEDEDVDSDEVIDSDDLSLGSIKLDDSDEDEDENSDDEDAEEEQIKTKTHTLTQTPKTAKLNENKSNIATEKQEKDSDEGEDEDESIKLDDDDDESIKIDDDDSIQLDDDSIQLDDDSDALGDSESKASNEI